MNFLEPKNEVAKSNETQKIELYTKLQLLAYFETEEVSIQLFQSGNQRFKELANLDLQDIKSAAGEHNQAAWRTRDLLHLESVRETERANLAALLEVKFKESEYLTREEFALNESENIKLRYGQLLGWFPVLRQWVRYLNDISKSKFDKTNKERSENGQKGGAAKHEKGYHDFLAVVKKKNISVAEYINVSNENFKTVLNENGLAISAKTADKYRKKYLSEHNR